MKRLPPVEVTLPRKVADGPSVTKRLIFFGPRGGHVWRTSLNGEAWKPSLAAAGVIPVPEKGKPHAESRENGMHALRHFYASVLLDAWENVKALAEYLGHCDPGLTLRVYAHLMPSRDAPDRLVPLSSPRPERAPDGPATAPGQKRAPYSRTNRR